MNHLSINIKGSLHHFHKPWVMGILNVTPDSFFAESRTIETDDIRRRIDDLISQGADIIDIGGYSSRPGAPEVSADEEYSRLARGLEAIRKYHPDTLISVDTFRADVARRCVSDWEADIINDISGGNLDAEMWPTVAELQVPYILMHMRGTPSSMQSLCDYNDVTADVIRDLAFKIDAMHQLGIADIIVDPGFGFAKDINQNYQLMAELDQFKQLNAPLLVGISRKSMIYRPLDITPQTAINGTTVLNTFALLHGANILRVHDVKEAVEAVKIIDLIKQNTP
ncbi:MAG: dihydropteroate synthase [Muribaculaceae bacterium]|jgi:dihydropteroate synthase|nr:dihydropteroate synthase [Muribaculaceae bacterium]